MRLKSKLHMEAKQAAVQQSMLISQLDVHNAAHAHLCLGMSRVSAALAYVFILVESHATSSLAL